MVPLRFIEAHWGERRYSRRVWIRGKSNTDRKGDRGRKKKGGSKEEKDGQKQWQKKDKKEAYEERNDEEGTKETEKER
jgi:hypothetical protein